MEFTFLADLPNLFMCLLAVYFVTVWAKLPHHYTFLLAAHSFIPFFLNDVLFSASYMGDQFRYWGAVQSIREGGGEMVSAESTVGAASWMLAFIPLPFTETIQSLGFFNKFVYILLFGFLYKRQFLTPFSASFFLLYPSFALYSGLSLRDTLIAVSMIMAAYCAIKNYRIMAFMWLVPLYFIKFQNLYIMAPLLFVYLFLGINKNGMTPRRVILFLGISVISMVAAFPVAQPLLNHYRAAMFMEDGGQAEAIQLIAGLSDFLNTGTTSGLYFLIKPFLWEASGILQFIQSIENIGMVAILFMLIRQAWLRFPKRLMFWLFFLVMSCSIYGLVVFNYGTVARYRFPFITIFVICVAAECHIHQLRYRRSDNHA